MRNAFALVLAALALGACGKSLHVSEKAAAYNTKRNLLGEPIAQKLGGLSNIDLKEVETGDLTLPFGKEGTQFRALHFVPRSEVVENVSSLKLSLKGLKINDVAVDDQTDLSKGTLCLLQKGFQHCSGTDMPSGFTALGEEKKLPIVPDANAKGSFTIDLLDAFGLQGKDAGQVMAFLEQISSDYDGKGYRKFRFSIGKNIGFEEGSLELQTELKKGTKPIEIEVPGAPTKEGDDQMATEESVQQVIEKVLVPVMKTEAKPQETNANPGSTGSDETPAENLNVEKVVDSNSILFSGKRDGTQYLKPDAEAKLNRITDLIATYQESIEKVFIQVQTDRDGRTDRNVTLSKDRAEYIRKNLVGKANTLEGRTVAAGIGAVPQSSCDGNKCPKDRKFTITITMNDGTKTRELQEKLDQIR
jgi:outer membrane protein OmpA-like peptidoglycan-associated protein